MHMYKHPDYINMFLKPVAHSSAQWVSVEPDAKSWAVHVAQSAQRTMVTAETTHSCDALTIHAHT